MSAPIANIYLVATNRKPVLTFTYEDVDLDDYASITLRVRRENNTLLEIAAVIDDADAGEFHFEWGSGDLTPGTHAAEVVFTDSDGLELTLPAEGPMHLIVRERV